MRISLIAAIDEKRGLGQNNHLLCHLPADLQHFKNMTLGKPIIMGRKTYDSIGKALPGRLNIVLSQHTRSIPGAQVVSSLAEMFNLLNEVPEIMIIGGASIFAQTLPLASRIYLTIIHHQFVADSFFPLLDLTSWQCKETIFRPQDEKNSYDLTFKIYESK